MLHKKRERNICSVNNCRSYREANRWPEPLTFHEFPADLARRKLWLEIIEREDWVPGDKAKICAMHFTPECYREATASAVKRLNATAVPSLNLILEPLPKSGLTKAANTARAKNSLGVVASSTSTAQAYYVCSAMNCRQYREAQLWPEPLSFHEFPADPERKKLWIESLTNGDWIPKEKGKVCSMHFDMDDYRETNKKLLKPNAVPSLNLSLKKLTESEIADQSVVEMDYEHERLQYGLKESDAKTESRKRISNIIIVDLIKDKKSKNPEKPKPIVIDESCSTCMEMKKDLREVEFQLAMVKQELEEQKRLVESLRKQIKN